MNRRGVATQAATAAAALLFVACGGGGGTAETVPGFSTTTTAPPLAVPQVSASGSVSVTVPPGPGTYTYSQTGTSLVKDQGRDPEARDATGTLVVSEPEETPRGAEVTMDRDEGGGNRQEQVLLYNGEGISIVHVTNYVSVVNKIDEFECTPDRPVLILPVDIGPGSSWQDRVACGGGQLDYSASVVGAEPLTLGDGSVVDTIRIDVSVNVSASGSRTLRTKSRQTYWFAPGARLQVKVRDETEAQLSVYDMTRSGVDVLQSATPR